MLQIGAILFFAVIVSDSVRKSVNSHFYIHTFGAKSVISNHGSKCEFLSRFYLTRKAFCCQERKGYGASTAAASAQRTANLHTKTAKEKSPPPDEGKTGIGNHYTKLDEKQNPIRQTAIHNCIYYEIENCSTNTCKNQSFDVIRSEFFCVILSFLSTNRS